MPNQLEQLTEEEELRALEEAMLEQQMQSEALRSQGQGGGGMQPNMNMAQQFMGGGDTSGFGGGGALTDAGSANAAGGESSMMSSAGPWAALAAAIILNEGAGRKAGRRADSKSEHLQDALTGKVLEQDTDYYGDKIGGAGGSIVKGLGKMGHPEGQFEFVKKSTKNMFKPWEIFR